MNTTFNPARRDFIKVVSVAGGGLILGFYLPSKEELLATEPVPATAFAPNAWLRIDLDGSVTVTVAKSEMGQGVRTSLPMLLAEELEADWSKIRIEPALADPKYGDMTTGGSTSVRKSWLPLRKAGATPREMLISAAAQTWGVERATCRAEQGAVIHVPSGRSLTYGQLVETAAKLPVPALNHDASGPADVPLKDTKDFRIIGKSAARLDTPEKLDGKAVFGLDVKVPGMLVATVARCPVFGGKVKSFDATKAMAVKGVRHVAQVPSGVAVVADSTWAAMQGREALAITWDEGPSAGLDSAGIRKMFEESAKKTGMVARSEGDAAGALAAAAKKLEAIYEFPFLAHATMEPMNCVADVRKDGAEIWAPTQSPQWAQGDVAKLLGLPEEKVKVHTTLLGGGFGRRAMPDFVVEAAHVSKAAGAPVKVVWTREDDMQHDFYRPASYHRVGAGIDSSGRLVAWTHRLVAPSVIAQVFGIQPKAGEADAVDGAAQLPYSVPNLLVDYVMVNTAVPVGWWRSVYNSQNPFVNECFLDEVAAAAGKDPYEFRRQLLPEGSRLRRVLELAATNAGWGKPLPAGHARGIAGHFSFGSYIAQVAEVSVEASGKAKVHRVVCAVDCGQVVNPNTIEAQMESGIVFGLTAALKGAITIEKGRAQQSNFHDYEMLRMDEMPLVEVHIQASKDAPGGVGEPGTPPIAPAVANAVFAVTGKRIRRLPIRAEDLR